MHLARRLLSESPFGLSEIAARVGYDSETAFNGAFRRVVGVPPASWRQAKAFARRIEDEQPGQEGTDATGDHRRQASPPPARPVMTMDQIAGSNLPPSATGVRLALSTSDTKP
jgi:hypothetical protein